MGRLGSRGKWVSENEMGQVNIPACLITMTKALLPQQIGDRKTGTMGTGAKLPFSKKAPEMKVKAPIREHFEIFRNTPNLPSQPSRFLA